MELLALHIYHLDDDEEADRVVQLLERIGLADKWLIERPTDRTNAIFVPIVLPEDQSAPDWKVRQNKLKQSLELLQACDKETIDAIKRFGLHIAVRIHTREFYLPLPADFVVECGRLGLEICILNSSAPNQA